MKNKSKLFFSGLILFFSAIYRLLYRQQQKYDHDTEGKKIPEPEEDFWQHDFIEANGVRFHFVTAGQGPLLILLHGFPENWYGWRQQISVLAERYKVMAVDLRGYNLSDKPRAMASYKMEHLTEDLRQLISNSGYSKAVVVGHDWGGAIAWSFAMLHPDMVDRLVVLNCPHPAKFFRAGKNFRQWLKSWYIFLFQLPVIPEGILLSDRFGLWEKFLLRAAVHKERAFSEAEKNYFAQALRRPGALTSMLNYYRAVFRFKNSFQNSQIKTPTLLLWGEKDPIFSKNINRGIEKQVPNIRVRYLPDAGHWVHREAVEEVNMLLREFLFR